ncbi:MAG: hypothetical protein FWF84_06285, partial [Kiritimatiellaeota bacterium]|nr:hypothetical protein [Kiritimatiellota bacterium]
MKKLMTLGMMVAAVSGSAETFAWEEHESAGISGFAWDRAEAGSRVVDAVHRSVLLRFPGAAEALAEKLNEGHAIATAAIVMEYAGYESRRSLYVMADSDAWEKDVPEWHVQAWALRRPWKDPTFNAAVGGVEREAERLEGSKAERESREENVSLLASQPFSLSASDGGSAAVYWTKYGARDVEHDRYPAVFGPSELSQFSTVARLDVTSVLTDVEYGATLGERLRNFEERGLLMQKWELYDARYHDFLNQGYEWVMCMGGSAITYSNAVLEITLAKAVGGDKTIVLPPPTALSNVAVGAPTAVMPSDEEIVNMKGHFFQRQPWMSPWQWENIQGMEALAYGFSEKDLESGDPELYRRTVRGILSEPPRFWWGFSICQRLLRWYLYRDLLPAPVQDYIVLYWESQLMPDRPTHLFGHMQQANWDGGINKYYEATGDWRGNAGFYRGSYTQSMSTMGFNHQAVVGALLGGAIIDGKVAVRDGKVMDGVHAIGDGRYGLEHLILRLWNSGGTSQQSMEFNYAPTSLVPQKMFADYGVTPFDRLIGRVVVGRMVDEIAASYHPGLRRIIYPIGRTNLAGMLMRNSGLSMIMHTMSPSGALFTDDLSENTLDGLAVLDMVDGAPDVFAYFSVKHPWLPNWTTNMVDHKIMPARATVQNASDGLKRNYLGNTYGIGSQFKAQDYQVAPIMAQWKYNARQPQSAREVRSFTLNHWVDESYVRHQYNERRESIDTVHHDNTMIVLMTPKNLEKYVQTHTNMTSLLGSIAFFSFEQGGAGLPTCDSEND